MRQVLGRGERERVVRKYMDEMGEQWRGAGAGLDYVLGLTVSEEVAERQKADAELASWVWRNLLGSRGLTAPPEGEGKTEETMGENLELVVRFVRREMARLDGISDADVINGNIGEWGNPAS
jgi:cytochrome b pre-mRNA-processing protein 3